MLMDEKVVIDGSQGEGGGQILRTSLALSAAFGKTKGRLDLSEEPQAYKDIEDVIASELDLVEPLVRLVPLASLKG